MRLSQQSHVGLFLRTYANIHNQSHLPDSRLPGLECLHEVDIHHWYQSSIFTGFAADLTNPSSQVRCLESRRGILGVWPSAVSGHLSTNEKLEPVHSPIDAEHAVSWINSSTLHSTTGVDVLHEQGINGRGVKIAVIDTGMDYLNPGLGGGMGLGFTVSFGQNYAEGDSSDPYDECSVHATHVAGIIAVSKQSIRSRNGFQDCVLAPVKGNVKLIYALGI